MAALAEAKKVVQVIKLVSPMLVSHMVDFKVVLGSAGRALPAKALLYFNLHLFPIRTLKVFVIFELILCLHIFV